MEPARIKNILEQNVAYMPLLTMSEINGMEERCNKIKGEKWEICKVSLGDDSGLTP